MSRSEFSNLATCPVCGTKHTTAAVTCRKCGARFGPSETLGERTRSSPPFPPDSTDLPWYEAPSEARRGEAPRTLSRIGAFLVILGYLALGFFSVMLLQSESKIEGLGLLLLSTSALVPAWGWWHADLTPGRPRTITMNSLLVCEGVTYYLLMLVGLVVLAVVSLVALLFIACTCSSR